MLDGWQYLLLAALGQTLLMVGLSGLITVAFGMPLGFISFATKPQGIMPHRLAYTVLATTSNALRSIPFIILMVAIVPLTRLITGTSIGSQAAMVPLVIAAVPFFARLVENALQEVPSALVDSAVAMGATPLQIMRHVLLPEALPGLIHAMTVTLIALISYSAMAGAVGGGGLGDLGVRYGYQRFNSGMMCATVLTLIALVQCLQWAGDWLARKLDRR